MRPSSPPHLWRREPLPTAGADVSVAVDDAGRTYLVVAFAARSGPCWIWAPVSERAIDCVRAGRASPWAVVHHSTTGTVGLSRTLVDGSVRDSLVLCDRLPAGATVLSAA